MSISIGFSIGAECTVNITEEHDGEKQTTKIDARKFLEDTGLGIYFFQLKPDFAKAFYKVKPRRGQIVAHQARIGAKHGNQEKTSK
jgi:hypothetical protein